MLRHIGLWLLLGGLVGTQETTLIPNELRAPEYPDSAVKAKMDGTVRVAIWIQPDGIVGNASIDASVNPMLDASALKAAREWRYEPIGGDGQRKAILVFEFSVVETGPQESTCYVGPSQVTFKPPNVVKIRGWLIRSVPTHT